jgi:cholesterol oxidase
MNFDVIVIGSGFGGAITGCRLAEGGYKVLILERGRRWDKTTYPREPGDPWLWNQERPEKLNGWADLRVFPNMSIIQGAGVGGGSLIYANILAEAHPSIFQRGWPPEITYNELKPHYDRVGAFMNVQQIPVNQLNARTLLMKEAAEKIGHGDRFKLVDLAVSFDPALTFDPNNPLQPSQSRRFINAQGVEQGTCVHLGACDVGCPVDAKNTLDLNYIPWAEKHGAQVRPLHFVTNIEPVTGGYKVSCDELKDGRRVARSETARLVIVAAGSLGSTELLMRCRDEKRSLPNVSQYLGRDWSSNGDFLTPAFYRDRDISPMKGITIAGAIDFLDGSQNGQVFWVEDGGIPDLLGFYLGGVTGNFPPGLRADFLIKFIQNSLRRRDAFKQLMPWFAQGVDGGDGRLSLKRPWWWPFGRRRLHLSWDVDKSKPVINEIIKMHKRLSEATEGRVVVPPTWTISKDLITPHPLGGCKMGVSPESGVVNHLGEVFGHRNLYVADGAIVPVPLGVNPSRTIGALAERVAQNIKNEGR